MEWNPSRHPILSCTKSYMRAALRTDTAHSTRYISGGLPVVVGLAPSRFTYRPARNAARIRDQSTNLRMFPLILGISSKFKSNGQVVRSKHECGRSTLLDCIAASPLLVPCGLTTKDVAEALPLWQRKGMEIATNLGLVCDSFESMSLVHRRRIFQYYLPVYFWFHAQLMAHRSQNKKGPLIVGISAPQGCGKSTLCEQVVALFASDGFTAASISTDDFYLTYEQQRAVASANPGNPLLEMRGNAGSHDLELGSKTLAALKAAQTIESVVGLPRYDKSAYQGKGDRAPASSWPQLRGPVDIVLFEGWGLGFSPVGPAAAAAVDPHLVPVDTALEKYKTAWDDAVDVWFVVKVGNPEYAYKWRLQAERAMRSKGKPAMTDEQVAAFVDRFMPAYRAYLPGLYSTGPTTARPGKLLVVEVDASREPVAQQPL